MFNIEGYLDDSDVVKGGQGRSGPSVVACAAIVVVCLVLVGVLVSVT